MQTTAANEACIIRGWEVVANDKGVLTNCFMSHHRYTSADVEREKCGVQVDDLRTLLRTCFFFVGSGPFFEFVYRCLHMSEAIRWATDANFFGERGRRLYGTASYVRDGMTDIFSV